MDSGERERRAGQRLGVMAGLVVAGAATTWLAAALLVWVLVPRLAADPALAGSAAEVAIGIGVFALSGALAGALMLVGLAVTWRRPRQTAGRVLLLVAGLLAIVDGLLLVNVGVFDLAWRDGAAAAGLAGAAASIAAGLVACVASLTTWLPGASLVARMMLTEPVHPTTPARERMLPLTAALVVGWVVSTAAFLASASVVPFMAALWGMPILAGVVVAGWRAGEANRLQTLAMASAAGMVTAWLFFLALVVAQYYHFNPAGFAVWWGVMGALFGMLGYSLWGPLSRLGGRLHLHPR